MTEATEPFIIPTTNGDRIIFQYHNIRGYFDLTEYRPEMTDYRLSVKDAEKFFERVQNYLEPWRKAVKTFSILIFLFCIVSIGGALSIPLVYLATEDMKIILYLMIPLVVGLSFRILWSAFKPARDIPSKLQEARTRITLLLESRQGFLEPRGLRWYLPEHFPEWIELWKDYNRIDTDNQSHHRHSHHEEIQIIE